MSSVGGARVHRVCSYTSTIDCPLLLFQGHVSHVAAWHYKVTSKIFLIPYFQ